MLFIPQSHEPGVRSLWTPHAGYLLLYSRVVALPARPVPACVPYVFFLASVTSFIAIVSVLKNCAESAAESCAGITRAFMSLKQALLGGVRILLIRPRGMTLTVRDAQTVNHVTNEIKGLR
jgi:hypothetical protein